MDRARSLKLEDPPQPSTGVSPTRKLLLQNHQLADQKSRTKQRGLINSHSNKRLPTEQESLILEMGRLSNPADPKVAERSLDRVKAQQVFNGARDAF